MGGSSCCMVVVSTGAGLATNGTGAGAGTGDPPPKALLVIAGLDGCTVGRCILDGAPLMASLNILE